MRLVLVLVLLLTGCSFAGDVDPDIDAVGRKIVADWKQRPEVAEAWHRHTHDLLGPASSVMRLEVTLKAEAITDAVVDELVEIAVHNCWRGTWKDCNATYAVYTTADPPDVDKPGTVEPVRRNWQSVAAEGSLRGLKKVT